MDNTTATPQAPTKFCKHCGAKIAEAAVICTHCGCQVEEMKKAEQAQPSTHDNVSTKNDKTKGIRSVTPEGMVFSPLSTPLFMRTMY